MPEAGPATPRVTALIVVAVLAIASVALIALGVAPSRVSASEVLGTPREPGAAAFVAGHRGDSTSAPENTLPAVRAAIAGGYDYVEVDIALTADRVAVLMHDETVDRTTDGAGPLAALTFAEVRGLDAGSWFHPSFTGTPVPMFVEFLDILAASDRRGLVELKGEWAAADVTGIVSEIEARGLERRVALASFDAGTLGLVQSASPVLSRLAILRSLPDDVVAAARAFGVNGVIANGKAVLARPEVVGDLRAAGVRLVVYTFNRDKQWDAAIELGVDGIVTDTPEALADWLTATLPPTR